MAHSPELITCWVTKQASVNLTKLKSYQASFPTTTLSSVQFSSVAQLCPTLCDPMNRSTPGLPVHHQLQEFSMRLEINYKKKKNKTEHKHMVMKQYITKQPMNHGRNKRRNKRNKMYLGTNENESTMIQTYEIQQK